MSSKSPNGDYPLGRLARRLALLALPAVILIGCSDDGAPPPAPTATATVTAVKTATAPPANTATVTLTATRTVAPPTQTPPPTQTTPPTQTAPPTSTSTPNASAASACAKLAGCDQCFIDANGNCIANETCAQRLSGDAAICVNSTSGCDATTLGDCLFLGCQGNDATGECQ